MRHTCLLAMDHSLDLRTSFFFIAAYLTLEKKIGERERLVVQDKKNKAC